MTDDVVDDPFFYPTLDLTDGFQTKSALCVPIRIESSVCGVLELVNRDGSRRLSREGPAPARDLRRLRLDLDPEPARRAARLRGRQARRPDRPLQRALPAPAPDAGALADLARRRRLLRRLPRPRQPESRQRPARAPGRQPGPARGRLPAAPHGDRRARDADPLRRRRVRPDPARPQPQEGMEVCRGDPHGDPQRDVPVPALRLQRAGAQPPGRDHRLARRLLDPLARDRRGPRSSSRRTSSCAPPTPRSTAPRSTARTAARPPSLEDARIPADARR